LLSRPAADFLLTGNRRAMMPYENCRTGAVNGSARVRVYSLPDSRTGADDMSTVGLRQRRGSGLPYLTSLHDDPGVSRAESVPPVPRVLRAIDRGREGGDRA
jgi:hypothetical protein